MGSVFPYGDNMFSIPGEVRGHGVGYYGFSKDVAQREEQLKELKKLSEQTAATREKVLKERGQKSSQLKARLKKIRARKRAKLGLPPEPDNTNDDDDDDDDEKGVGDTTGDEAGGPPGAKKDRVDLDPSTAIIPGEEGLKEMRPWDFGKPGVFGPRPTTFDELDEKWLRDRRSDRNSDFAPPTSLYSEGGLKKAYGGGRKEATTTSSSSASNAFQDYPSSSRYSNFVKAKEPLTSPEETSEPFIGPEPVPASMKPFMPPGQFWKGQGGSNKPSAARGHGLPPQKPIPIVDELPAPVAESSDEFERGRGREIAPPPTFDYYHGQTSRPTRGRGKSGKTDEVVADAVSSGLKALRERFDSEQRAKGMKEDGDKKEFKGFI